MPFALARPVTSRVTVAATSNHGFFEHLVAAEGGVAGYTYGHVQAAGGSFLRGPMRHRCFLERVEIECDPTPILAALARFSWPTSLELTIDPMPSTVPPGTKTTAPDGVQRLIGSLHAQAFLTYYENAKARIGSIHGGDAKLWPDTLKFARMTRNAFGHGGKLDIRDPNATSEWRGLVLSTANDGEQMLYNHIASGDVILLMLDVEDLL